MTKPALRNTGIDVIGQAPWGTHFCQFYQTKEDLADTLVPYFKAGLLANEFCMWVTAEPLVAKEAEGALRKALPDLDTYLENRQIEILPYGDWYLKAGAFESQTVLDGWVDKVTQAEARGFDGLRLSGNTFWLEKSRWNDFTEYEEEVNNVIGNYNMIALCTYSLDKCGASEIVDVIRNHQFALIKREGRWETIESAERRRLEERRKETEATLRESEARYRMLFEHLGEGFVLSEMIYDEDGQAVDYRFLAANPAFEQLTGLKPEDVIGRTVREAIPGIEQYWIDTYGEVVRTGRPIRFEGLAAPLGRWYEVLAFSPEKGRFAALFLDVTERRRIEGELREREADLNRAQAVAHLGSWRLDVQRDVLDWSDESYRLFGVPPGRALTYETFLSFVHPEDREKVDRAWQAALHGATYDIDHRIIVDGTVKWIRERAELDFDPNGELRGGFGTCQDITVRKQAEEELRKANALKDDFIGMVSHEMRTPLTAIIGGASLLLGPASLKAGESRELIEEIRAGSQRLSTIIENMLWLARADARKPELAPVTVSDVVDEVIAKHRDRYATREVRKRIVGETPAVVASKEYVVHILSNLLENAEKYTPQDSAIEVDLQRDGERMAIRVLDRGIGLKPEEVESVFEPFYRSPRVDKLSPGVGIGLTVSKRLVEAMGGRIWAVPREGGGSEFGFSLAMAPPPG
jgi:PAS domain S-box-containing protein